MTETRGVKLTNSKLYQYLKHKDIDFKLWDECIDASPNGIIYALSWYLNITAPGWEGIVKIENGKYVSVMPVPVFRKFGIKYVKQPTHTQLLGLFSRENKLASAEIKNIFNLLKSRFWYIQKYSFNTNNVSLLKIKIPEFNTTTHHTFHIDLNRNYEEIYKSYSTNRKRNVKKGQKCDILLRETYDIELLIKVFQDNVAPKIYGLDGKEFDLLRNIFYITKEQKQNFILEARDKEGKILGMSFFLVFNRIIIYLFGATTKEGNRKEAMPIMLDSVVQKFSSSNFTFDLESPEIPSLVKFYQQFGSTPAPFLSVSYNKLPGIIKAVKDIRFYLYRKFINSPDSHK